MGVTAGCGRAPSRVYLAPVFTWCRAAAGTLPSSARHSVSPGPPSPQHSFPPTGRGHRMAQRVTPPRAPPPSRGHRGDTPGTAKPPEKRGAKPAAGRGGRGQRSGPAAVPSPSGSAGSHRPRQRRPRPRSNRERFVPAGPRTAEPLSGQVRRLRRAGSSPGASPEPGAARGWSQGGGRWHRGGAGAAAGTWQHTWHRGHRDQGRAGTRAAMPRAGLCVAAALGLKQGHQ